MSFSDKQISLNSSMIYQVSTGYCATNVGHHVCFHFKGSNIFIHNVKNWHRQFSFPIKETMVLHICTKFIKTLLNLLIAYSHRTTDRQYLSFSDWVKIFQEILCNTSNHLACHKCPWFSGCNYRSTFSLECW